MTAVAFVSSRSWLERPPRRDRGRKASRGFDPPGTDECERLWDGRSSRALASGGPGARSIAASVTPLASESLNFGDSGPPTPRHAGGKSFPPSPAARRRRTPRSAAPPRGRPPPPPMSSRPAASRRRRRFRSPRVRRCVQDPRRRSACRRLSAPRRKFHERAGRADGRCARRPKRGSFGRVVGGVVADSRRSRPGLLFVVRTVRAPPAATRRRRTRAPAAATAPRTVAAIPAECPEAPAVTPTPAADRWDRSAEPPQARLEGSRCRVRRASRVARVARRRTRGKRSSRRPIRRSRRAAIAAEPAASEAPRRRKEGRAPVIAKADPAPAANNALLSSIKQAAADTTPPLRPPTPPSDVQSRPCRGHELRGAGRRLSQRPSPGAGHRRARRSAPRRARVPRRGRRRLARAGRLRIGRRGAVGERDGLRRGQAGSRRASRRRSARRTCRRSPSRATAQP